LSELHEADNSLGSPRTPIWLSEMKIAPDIILGDKADDNPKPDAGLEMHT